MRRLAYEAADSGLLSPELAAGIRRVKGSKKLGIRLGNWLIVNEARALWQLPDARTLKGKRDRAILAVLLGCGLRRGELTELTLDHLQRREDHWAIVDLIGKAGHIRTVPMPDWVKQTIDDWLIAAGILHGKMFRCVCRKGTVWGTHMTEKFVWHVRNNLESRNSLHTISDGLVLASAMVRVANWSRFSSCWDMFECRQRKNISVVSSALERQ